MDREGVIAIGGTGLVGSRIQELLSSDFTITTLSRSAGFDITSSSLPLIEEDVRHPVVLLLAAKTDVDGCEADKDLKEEGEAWKINVEGVRNVVQACKASRKKLVLFSTDFVFDGEKGDYTEDDSPNPINWYGKTKYEGEKMVQSAGIPHLIVRISYPYRAEFVEKNDFVRAILGRLQKKEEVHAVNDQIFTPTFIDDIAIAVKKLLETESSGIYHVVGSESLSPFDAAQKIAETFGLDKNLIQKTTRAEFFKNRAPRPFNLSMRHDKISKLGVHMNAFSEGIKKIHNR